MKVYDAQSLRNVALVGHSGSGKTQLLSTLLFDAGAVNRLDGGRRHVGDGLRRRSDRPQAHPRIQPRLCRVEQDQINIIDTPGIANF
jgi:elongation factor G